jgi:hypothetical protein
MRRRVMAAVVASLAALTVSIGGSAVPAAASSPSAQVAIDWNLKAVTAVRAATLPLPKFQSEGFIYLSYVQAAVYDATTKIEGRYEPYHEFSVSGVDLDDARTDAAVIAATYTTLAHYLSDQPSTLLDPLKADYDAAIAALPSEGRDDGVAVGVAAAQDIIELRKDDGLADPSVTFTPGAPGPGVYQFAPAPSLQFAQTPWIRAFDPFLLDSPSQFRPPEPPELSSDRWATAFNRVKELGAVDSATRTPRQTAIAWFYNANTNNQYNQAFRDVAVDNGLDLVETVRLFAMGNMIAADALTACLNAKDHYAFWRPVTAIRAADDGNDATESDPDWTPLLVTPNHPEYPGAHGSITSAESEVFEAVLGTNQIDVTLYGYNPVTGLSDVTRHFQRSADLRHQVVRARLWAGLHYRFSSRAGALLGREVVHWALERYFLPE